ncbi:MAG: sulfotransferase family protein [Mariniblastus sp.]|nr:sulfotransferase family protein [Mariniblastus sp.]
MNVYFEVLAEQRIAYLLLRKCACSSIVGALEQLRLGKQTALSVGELHRERPTRQLAEQIASLPSWYTFTLVRDPVRRFLSFYSDKILSQSLTGNLTIATPGQYGYRTNMSLDDAIEVAVGGQFEADMHVIPCSQVIDQAGVTLRHIGRVEDFASSIDQIEQETGVRLPRLHLNPAKRIPLLINEAQFKKLSHYYAEDQERFGYPSDYTDWCQVHANAADFQREEGFEFENEAKLLRYSIRREQDRVVISLTWRVNPRSIRKRYIRVLKRVDGQQQILLRIRMRDDFLAAQDADGLVQDDVSFRLDQIETEFEPEQLCIDIYFWNPEKKRAKVLNFTEATELVLPIGAESGPSTRFNG